MNEQLIPLIYRIIHIQQPLNKALAKREINNQSVPCSQLLFWTVEILLRVYIVYCQHSYILIHQFNKKKNDITGIQVVPS